MYNVRVNIDVVILLQRYDISSNVVSVSYGKNANKEKSETAVNQMIVQNMPKHPMENIRSRYGKTGQPVNPPIAIWHTRGTAYPVGRDTGARRGKD